MGLRLLLIEDEELDFEVIRRITSKHMQGVELDRADTIKKGLEFVKNNTYDAIITDLRLPDSESDIDVIEKIKAITDTPIMVYSGSYLDKTLRKTIEAGARRYMTKGMIGMVKDIPENIKGMIKEYKNLSLIEKLNDELGRRNNSTS